MTLSISISLYKITDIISYSKIWKIQFNVLNNTGIDSVCAWQVRVGFKQEVGFQ